MNTLRLSLLAVLASVLLASGAAQTADLGPECSVYSVDLSANGEFLAVGWGTNVSFFETGGDEPLWTYRADGYVDVVVLSDDGRRLAIGYNDPPHYYEPGSRGHVAVFDTGVSEPLWTFTTDYPISGRGRRAMDMTRDGSKIVAGTFLWPPGGGWHVGTLYVFDWSSPTPVATHPFPSSIMSVRISGNGEYFVAGSYWWEMRLYGMSTGLICSASIGDPYYSVALDHDGTTIATGHGWAGQVRLYDNNCSLAWPHFTGGTHRSIAMADDGGSFSVSHAANPGRIENGDWLFSAASGMIWFCDLGDDAQVSIDMARDGNLIASGGIDGKLSLLDADHPEPFETYEIGDRIWEVSMAGDGSFVAAGSGDGVVGLVSSEGETGLVWTWDTPCHVALCHVSPGNPTRQRTITLGRHGAEAHLRAHLGDYLGECMNVGDPDVLTEAAGSPAADAVVGLERDIDAPTDPIRGTRERLPRNLKVDPVR